MFGNRFPLYSTCVLPLSKHELALHLFAADNVYCSYVAPFSTSAMIAIALMLCFFFGEAWLSLLLTPNDRHDTCHGNFSLSLFFFTEQLSLASFLIQ